MHMSFENLTECLDKVLELGAEHQLNLEDLSSDFMSANTTYTKLLAILNLELDIQIKKYQDKLREAGCD